MTERLELINVARGGGSITPRFAKTLQRHCSTGRLSLHTHTVISKANFNPLDQTWTVTTSPPIENLPKFHHIYFATGVQSDFQSLPYLQTLCKKFPIDSYGGLPALTDDLMWREDVPLFMTGKFASLRVGPGSANLEGARLGAERIAWGLQDFLEKWDGVDDVCGGKEVITEDSSEYRFAAGIGSRYESLAEGDECILRWKFT